ncbi:MAG TPA: DUF2341 domain-containing protein [Verrucomicrobiae bacterium]|nr:DUF2341 domain-containing protein [Verrucomicrobiae bacterium]
MLKQVFLGIAVAIPAVLAGSDAQAQSYSNAVMALSPAAYWPLTELAAPTLPLNLTAANSGSLGASANGYYGAWYQPSGTTWYLTNNIVQTNSIVADGKTMVCQRQPGQYVVVPRNTNGVPNPALTIVPPFSVEAWTQIGTVGNANGLIVSEGGLVNLNVGGPDANNPFYGGTQTGWAGFALGQYQDYIYFACMCTNAVGNKSSELDTSGYNQHKGFTVGSWVHVVATFDGTTETIYTNGVLSVSKKVTPNPAGLTYVPDPTSPIMIGNGADVSASYAEAFQGGLTEVAIYNTALSSDSVLAHFETAYGTNATYGATYTNAVLADNPVLYYRLNDSQSVTNAGYPSASFPVANSYGAIGSAGNGVYQPGTTPGVSGPPFPGFGSGSKGVAINGWLGGVDVGGGHLPSELNPTGASPLTLVSWVRGSPADSPGRFQEIVGHGDSSYRLALGQNGADVHFNPGPGPELQFTNLQQMIAGGFTVNDGKWHMVAGVSDGTTETLYIDGIAALSATVPSGIQIAGSTNDLILGGDSQYTVASATAPNTIRYLDGQLAHVAFWTNALSAAQIGQLYAAAGIAPTISLQPSGGSFDAGTNISLSVGARGSSPFYYQWYHNNAQVTGGTSNTLSFSPLKVSDSGNYYVVVTNAYGSVTSLVTQVTVVGTPVVEQQTPSAISVFAGASPTLRVNATGPEPLSYQWTLNGAAIPGATTSEYTVNNAQAGGTYGLTISNAFGSSSIAPVALSVVAAPTAPYPVAVLADKPMAYYRLDETAGTTAYDHVGGLNGTYTNVTLGLPGYTANFTPQTDPTELAAGFGTAATVNSYVDWVPPFLNFSTPASANAEFSIEAWINGGFGQNTDAGIVTLGYGNGGEQFNLDCGSAPAHKFRFFVRDAAGGVHAAASGVGPSDNNWHHVVAVCDEAGGNVLLYADGQLVGSGSISAGSGILSSTSSLSIGSRQSAQGSAFDNQFVGSIDDVSIYNVALSSNQVVAHYTAAGVAPRILQQAPQSITVNEGANATFSPVVLGTTPLSYQWLLNGQPIAGQTSASLVLSNVTTAINGNSYNLSVSNLYGSVQSDATTLIVNGGPPSLVTDLTPTNQTVYAGTMINYSVEVSGSAPFHYQWLLNGSPISNATNASYSFAALVGTNQYSVTVSNNFGQVSPPPSVALLIGVPVPSLNPGDFAYKTKISFPGYTRSEPLVDFPALVRLGTNVPGFSYQQFASPVGGDLRFTDAGGTRELPYEIDEWNDANGTSSVWVQIPSLASTNDYIWAYWGNAAAVTPLDWTTNGAVWAPSFGDPAPFKVVYHLKEGAFPFLDSTLQHIATNGVAPGTAPGVVGLAGSFNGSAWLDAGTNDLGDAFTLSAWVNIATDANSIQTLWANQHGGYGAPGFALFVNTYGNKDQKIDLASGNGNGGGNESTTGANSVSFGQWHLLTAAINRTNGTVNFYVDAASVGSSTSVVKDFPTLGDLYLGEFLGNAFGLHGAMDEARIQQGVSSDNWVWANYMTVAANSSFESYAGVAGSSNTVTVHKANGQIVLSWDQGTLQSATSVTGPYTDVTGAQSPYTVPATGPEQFYRVKVR